MTWIDAVRRIAATARRALRVRPPEPRIVRRVGVQCPHGGGNVEIALLMGHDGKPEAVLRCSADASCPPACDQACRRCAEAILARPHAVLVYPGGRPFEDVD